MKHYERPLFLQRGARLDKTSLFYRVSGSLFSSKRRARPLFLERRAYFMFFDFVFHFSKKSKTHHSLQIGALASLRDMFGSMKPQIYLRNLIVFLKNLNIITIFNDIVLWNVRHAIIIVSISDNLVRHTEEWATIITRTIMNWITFVLCKTWNWRFERLLYREKLDWCLWSEW